MRLLIQIASILSISVGICLIGISVFEQLIIGELEKASIPAGWLGLILAIIGGVGLVVHRLWQKR